MFVCLIKCEYHTCVDMVSTFEMFNELNEVKGVSIVGVSMVV